MKMNFHYQQIKVTFTRIFFLLVSTLSFRSFESEFGNRKWCIPQLNRGIEMTYVMQRQTDHVNVSRVLIIVMTIKITPINGRETATA